jgi:hypothetical protein
MVKGPRLIADIEPELKKRLFRALLEDDLTFTAWLRRQIDAYLEEKEPKPEKPKRRGRK